jgi:hypothetical protein
MTEDTTVEPALVAEDAAQVTPNDDGEKRGRREITRLREQLRSAQAEHEAALTTIRAQSRDRLLRAELRSEALRAGIVELADTSAISFAEDGTVAGADTVIAGLKNSKPYLFTPAKDTASFGATTSPALRAPQPAMPELIDARNLTREQWQAERARLLSRRS